MSGSPGSHRLGSDAVAALGGGGPGGRLSSVSLSGGFGTISMGYVWSASYNHYAAALDPTYFKGAAGGATYKSGKAVSYSSSAGDVSFQIDKQTGDDGKLEFGATAGLGPVGIGFGYWKNENDEESFSGVALSTGAGGIGLAVGLGNVNSRRRYENKHKPHISEWCSWRFWTFLWRSNS